ncbi:hypothetical protein RCL1_001080 [Eukaryota sp. TZLM3-RCL]
MEEVMPNIHHYHCVHHLVENFKKHGGRGSAKAVPLLWRAARACEVELHEELMSRVREMCPSGHEYLQQTITKEKWAEAFLPQSRWGHLTSNICECINGVFVADRALPVTQLVENIRLKLAEWFVSRREDARATSAVWTKPVEDLMKEFTEEIPTMEMNVLDIESEVFEIRDKGKVYVVDLGMKGCSCGNWRDGLICRHALKAVRDTHKDLLLLHGRKIFQALLCTQLCRKKSTA